MAEQEREVVKFLIGTLNDALVTPIDQLIRTQELGTQFSFEPIRVELMSLLSVWTIVRAGAPWPHLSDGALEVLRGPLVNSRNILVQVRQFQPDRPNAPTTRKDLMVSVKNTETEAFRNVGPLLLALQPDGVSQAVTQVRAATQGAMALLDDVSTRANKILEDMQAAATKVGITKHATYFADQAKSHRTAAWIWMGWTALMFGALVGLAGWSIRYYAQQAVQAPLAPANLSLLVSKVVLASVLFSGGVMCARLYRANRHNCVVNEHRKNALASFQAFVDGTADRATKDAVLLQATTSIFAPQATGYVAAEGDGDGMPQIIEIIKTMTQKG